VAPDTSFAARVVALALMAAAPAAAQQARPATTALDTAAATEVSNDGTRTTGSLVVDAVFNADLGHGFEILVRPFVQRLPGTAARPAEWNRQIWVAALRYERRGSIGVRVDAGLIPSPVGLSNLLLRPQLNPTISLPASLFQPLPRGAAPWPRATLLGAVYPYGASITVSGAKWDARAAVIDTSPLRTRRVFARTNPPRFANVVVGGGITPLIGVRIGASLTHGGWQRGGETGLATSPDRRATITTVESEVSFGYTRLMGEWVRDGLDTDLGPVVAHGWWVLGQQTLTPRWFVAARVERMSAPAPLVPVRDPIAGGPAARITLADFTLERQQLFGIEETVGFRLTPAVTLRGGHRVRRLFARATYDHVAQMSLVWWQRWW
jgi:hypothetical protein